MQNSQGKQIYRKHSNLANAAQLQVRRFADTEVQDGGQNSSVLAQSFSWVGVSILFWSALYRILFIQNSRILMSEEWGRVPLVAGKEKQVRSVSQT